MWTSGDCHGQTFNLIGIVLQIKTFQWFAQFTVVVDHNIHIIHEFVRISLIELLG